MNQITDTLRDSKRLRLIATALELMQYERTDSAVIPIPGTDPQRYVTIGTVATVARLLEIAPEAPASEQQAEKVSCPKCSGAGSVMMEGDCSDCNGKGYGWEPAATTASASSPDELVTVDSAFAAIAHVNAHNGHGRLKEAHVMLVRAALARAPLPAQADAKDCRKLGGSCGCAFGHCANGLDQPATAYATPAQAVDVARDAARLEKFIDWYLRGGQRSEIHPYGHVEHTTREHILAWLDHTNATGGSKP